MNCDYTMCGAPGCEHCFPPDVASVRYVFAAEYARRVAASTRRLIDVIDNEEAGLSVQEALDAVVDTLAALLVTEGVDPNIAIDALARRVAVMRAAVGAAVEE